MSAMSTKEHAQRNRMRKGTRSCLECRTRKIRCIFAPSSRVCNSCSSHGKQCVEQSYGHIKEAGIDKRVGLKDRVKELEALVNQLLQKEGGDTADIAIPERYRRKLDAQNGVLSPPESNIERDHSPPDHSTAQLAQNAIDDIYDAVDDLDASLIPDPSFDKSQVLPLFDNPILQHDKSSNPLQSATPGIQPSRIIQERRDRFGARLRALIPHDDDLRIILKANVHFEPIWRQALTPDISDASSVESALLPFFRSPRLEVLCKGLLYLTLLLQQLPASGVQHLLERLNVQPGMSLIDKYIITVEEYFVSSDGILGSLECLECSVIMAQILINDGRPRKAWVCFQRCIVYARILGYHRKSSWQDDKNNPQSIGPRREKLWWSLFQGERYLASILGQPYSISDKHVDVTHGCGTKTGEYITTQAFMRKLAVITGHIIDRSQDQDQEAASSFASAMTLDGELHSLSVMVPESWWDPTTVFEDTYAIGISNIWLLYERGKAQFWYHHSRMNLHMPFMMKTFRKTEDSNMYEYNRSMALRSSRAMIRCHTFLRSRPDFGALVCQVIDYQVFSAAMLIILDMLERPEFENGEQDSETVTDTELILTCTSTLRRLSQLNSCRNDIAGQAVQVLETVSHVLNGCPLPKGRPKQAISRVIIPYFGAITIRPTSGRSNKRKQCNCCHQEFPTATPSDRSITTPETTSSMSQISAPESARGDYFIEREDLAAWGIGVGVPLISDESQSATDNSNQAPQPRSDQTTPGMAVDFTAADAEMLNEDVWGHMLDQDAMLDLDGAWNWLQVQ